MNRHQNLEIAVLNQISQAVMREKNVTALLRWVLEILYREMGLLRGTVTLRRGDQLFIEASHGLSDAEIRRGKYRLGEGITGQVALSGIPRVIPDISREPEFLDRTGARGRDSHVAFICVPIIHRDEVIGTLSIDREMTPGADLDRDFNLLEIVANLMADAVSLDLSEHDERARLRAENARLKQELDQVTGPPELIGRCQAMRRVYTMIAQVASSQYGGQSISLTHLAPFVDVSRKKIRRDVEAEMRDLGIDPGEEKISEIVEKRLREEIKRGVQTIQYQVVTLMTTNGQAPFITVFMYLNEAGDNQRLKSDLAIVIEEMLRQRYQGVKNEAGVWITPAFPKLIYVLENDNIYEGQPYYYLTKLAAKCTAKRMVPDYISEKKMLEYKVDKNGEGQPAEEAAPAEAPAEA